MFLHIVQPLQADSTFTCENHSVTLKNDKDKKLFEKDMRDTRSEPNVTISREAVISSKHQDSI